MAKIEGDSSTRICLTEEEVEKVYKAIKGKKENWARICVTSTLYRGEIVIYLQGPEGEEETILKVIED